MGFGAAGVNTVLVFIVNRQQTETVLFGDEEAVTFGIQNGVEPEILYEVICECAGSSWMFENRVPIPSRGITLPPARDQ